MVETITATYEHDNDDWTITVSGNGKELTGKAPGIIAARDAADQLVEKIAPNERPTVVHLLNGNALEFTSAYMAARLTLPEIEPLEIPPSGGAKAAKESEADASADAKPSSDAASSDSSDKDEPAAPDGKAPAGPASAAAAVEKAEPVKPTMPPGKRLPKEVEDRKPGEAKRPGVTAGASATPPAARA
ncbi:hypothetical protein [Amycolatopsis benzoatilytica]|uniref:hypothetical protein n=1 Tax=Amycolatopsis benzoatilytica TaxID=346045 RepID=UPI00036642EC|nr:hypothetical protein [Amycolatopsis benzoatilytica]